MKAMSKSGSKNSNSWKSRMLSRLSVIGCGLLLAVCGFLKIPGRPLGFTGGQYHQTVFPAGIVAMGFLIVVLGLIPDRLVERLARTAPRKNKINRH